MSFSFEISATNLPVMDSGLLGKGTDPYFVLYHKDKQIYRSETNTKSLNPCFKPFTLTVEDLPCESPLSAEIKLVMFDFDMMTANDPIGDLSFKIGDHLMGGMLKLQNVTKETVRGGARVDIKTSQSNNQFRKSGAY